MARVQTVREATSQPAKQTIAGDDPSDAPSSPTCLHGCAGMAAADDFMQLPI
jgi:hypothetical protein